MRHYLLSSLAFAIFTVASLVSVADGKIALPDPSARPVEAAVGAGVTTIGGERAYDDQRRGRTPPLVQVTHPGLLQRPRRALPRPGWKPRGYRNQ